MQDGHVRLLIRGAEVDRRLVDVVVEGGRVSSVAPSSGDGGVRPALGQAGDRTTRVVDAAGGALLPGLADHHIHLFATAAEQSSVDLGAGRGLAALAEAARAGTGWLRAVGADQELTRDRLDAIVPDRPVRVQHRSGAVWTLNSAGLDELVGAGDRPSSEERRTGRLWRADGRLRVLAGHDVLDLVALGRRLAARGLTTVVDASPDLTTGDLALLRERLPQRVESLGPAGGTMPRKIVIADHALPTYDDLLVAIDTAHRQGRAVAVHCVTQAALALLVAVLETTGTHEHDRVEHAAVCDDALAEQVARLGLTVVTQPSLPARHGDRYLAGSEAADRPHLWRYAGLQRAGVRVVASSDAPYGDPDPWRTVRAATERRTASGELLGAAEAVTAAEALRGFLTDPSDPAGAERRVAPGAEADLALLDRPLGVALAEPGGVGVRLTVCSGEISHDETAGPRTVPDHSPLESGRVT